MQLVTCNLQSVTLTTSYTYIVVRTVCITDKFVTAVRQNQRLYKNKIYVDIILIGISLFIVSSSLIHQYIMDKLSAEEISEFREIFNLVDKDGGGEITKAELGELLDTLGDFYNNNGDRMDDDDDDDDDDGCYDDDDNDTVLVMIMILYC